MRFPHLHDWNLAYREAVALQRELAGKVDRRSPLADSVRLVAGVDVSYEKHGEEFFAAVEVLSLGDWTLVEEASARARVSFPYIPGLLSFRELPVVLEAFRRLRTIPDVVLVDGQGIAHPRRLGIASHLGLWLDLPTVGCAKSRLCGEHEPPGPCRGDAAPLLLDGEVVGVVLTTRNGVRPLYISPGHRINARDAGRLVLRCLTRYRMPEPTRRAHLRTNQLRREAALLEGKASS